eukprot:GEMP01030724.1.p1 GENE.GEMP01030724.1~~GEMP01030724.1.p1  ORF type:complete len:555 (+),score=102.26 GEMP01030724.1:109-1773(+)
MHLLYVCAVIAVGRPILESETIVDVLASFDISLESHYVTTEDGYILNMHRLAGHDGQPVIFFQHGILASSIAWLVNDEASPPVYFWNRGYDVWLGNNRGNTYSRNHTSLDPQKDNVFWDFGFSTLGECDVPAQLNYVLDNTKKPNLTYVGWSQGTTQMFVNQIGNPLHRGNKCSHDKVSGINLFVALAPVVYLRYSPHRLYRWLSLLGILNRFEHKFSRGILLSRRGLKNIVVGMCESFGEEICAEMHQRISYNGPMNNVTAAANLLVLTPSGTSWKSVEHYAQLIGSKYFRDYDYGHQNNSKVYGQRHAPIYYVSEPSSITVPTAFFFAEKDAWVDKRDRQNIMYYIGRNPNVVFQRVYKDFDHDTWVLANKKAQVYLEDMARLVHKYNGEGLEHNGESLNDDDESLNHNDESLNYNDESLDYDDESLDNESLDHDGDNLENDGESIDDDDFSSILSAFTQDRDNGESPDAKNGLGLLDANIGEGSDEGHKKMIEHYRGKDLVVELRAAQKDMESQAVELANAEKEFKEAQDKLNKTMCALKFLQRSSGGPKI